MSQASDEFKNGQWAGTSYSLELFLCTMSRWGVSIRFYSEDWVDFSVIARGQEDVLGVGFMFVGLFTIEYRRMSLSISA